MSNRRNLNRRNTGRAELQALYDAQGGLCASCGRRMFKPGVKPENPSLATSTDHVHARAAGGGDDIRNKVAMHCGCNSAKMHRPPNGCELIWHAVVLAKLELGPSDYQPATVPRVTLADVWPLA